MDSPDLRRQSEAESRSSESLTWDSHEDTTYDDYDLPKYMIDLSLPPVRRYQHVAADFRAQAAALPALFDDLVLGWKPHAPVNGIRKLARLMLRRLHYKEEDEELRGISQTTGIKMWLLVALNVLLDIFMGCTSGAARVGEEQDGTRMLHFRTLDWIMDPLRKLVVQLDFVKKPGDNVIASSITYVGYVGVLTGVRKGLSMSLNMRPNHDRSGRLANFRFYFHHLLVLLGYRPSISSILRQQLLPSQTSSHRAKATTPTLESIEQTLPSTSTTAAYLIFSDGDRTVTMEKDHHTATIQSSSAFIVATNHDEAQEGSVESCTANEQAVSQTLQVTVMQDLGEDGVESKNMALKDNEAEEKSPELGTPKESNLSETLQATGMQGVIEDSLDRKNLALKFWEESLKAPVQDESESHVGFVTRDTLADWLVGTYPVTNENTHLAVIMDAKDGKVVWAERYLEPLDFISSQETAPQVPETLILT